MKIGILIADSEQLSNYELRIVNEIISNPSLELSLLIKDGRIGVDNVNSRNNRIKRLFTEKNTFGKLLFKIQVIIESKWFKDKSTVDRDFIFSKLEQIDTIHLKPERKGFLDIFSKEDTKQVSAYNLDIILRHEFGIIRGEILNSAKYGIWSFHHADNSINRGGPAGFWEIVLNQPTVGVTLQQLTPELDGGLIIDKAFFNYHYSYVKTNQLILEGSVSMLFKAIKTLQRGEHSTTESLVYFNPLYKSPGFKYALKYILNFYSKSFRKLFERIKYSIFGIRYNCWTLYIGKGDFLNAVLFRLKPVILPKSEYWADPFIFRHQNIDFIFFENYSYITKKGKITCGKIQGNQLVDITDVLDLEYHLSYPFIFEEDGDVFLMPETSDNNRLEVYKCVDFPNKWELYATAFEGEKVVDAHFYTDGNNQRWLFINKMADLAAPADSELYIYKVDSLKLNNLEPHTQNPVIINSETARNGGSIFKYKDGVYRPSQRNIEAVYGRALNINKIEELTLHNYSESTVVTTYPNFDKGLITMHHLHQTDNLFVIDAAYKRKR